MMKGFPDIREALRLKAHVPSHENTQGNTVTAKYRFIGIHAEIIRQKYVKSMECSMEGHLDNQHGNKYFLGIPKLLYFCSGELAEWSIAAVLKTVEVQASGGSNPSLSALSIGKIKKTTENEYFQWFFYFYL
jgi:hypothetical protein